VHAGGTCTAYRTVGRADRADGLDPNVHADLALSSSTESQPMPETKEREDMLSEEPSILFAAILLDEEG
jgi:hypothetical protein